MSEAIKKAIKEKARVITVGAGDSPIGLLRVEPGTFTLGSPANEEGRLEDEGPARKVSITQPFYLGKYPITQGQYTAITGKAPGKPAGADVAIDQLAYADAVEFCTAVTKAVGIPVTLPTEAQWEYACRAGTTTRFWSGDTDEDLAKIGWYRRNSEHRAHEVGTKPANPWGFYDMHGNVCECCRDFLPFYGTIPATDPVGRISRTEGIMRGGGWMHPAAYCRAASRLLSSDQFGGAGLRIAIAG